MTIFQRYNDDIKTEQNFKPSPEFVNKVYRFDDEGKHPEIKDIKTSEKEIGRIYITEEQYDKMCEICDKEYENSTDKRLAFKFEMVNYVLKNIRNRMMHGDFHNKTDLEGNKIVEIFPNDFKGKFFFDCIQEFYEEIANEINTNKNDFGKTKGERINDNVIFRFKEALLNNTQEGRDLEIAKILNDEEMKKEGFTSEDIKMMITLPLYVNGFITYNFKQKNSLEQLSKNFRQAGDNKKSEFLDEFYKSKSSDTFTSKVANFNNEQNNTNYLPNQVFEHFRNAVVHNNFVCKNGRIWLRDVNSYAGKINYLIIPYDFIKELIEKQYSLVKGNNSVDFPDSPNGEEK